MNISLDKVNAKTIVAECSPRHIQSVIEDLLQIAIESEKLASSVASLNPNVNEIGSGRLATLIDDANTVLGKITT